jgi:hypothetical protein
MTRCSRSNIRKQARIGITLTSHTPGHSTPTTAKLTVRAMVSLVDSLSVLLRASTVQAHMRCVFLPYVCLCCASANRLPNTTTDTCTNASKIRFESSKWHCHTSDLHDAKFAGRAASTKGSSGNGPCRACAIAATSNNS